MSATVIPDDVRERALRRVIIQEVSTLQYKMLKGHEVSRERVGALLRYAEVWTALLPDDHAQPRTRARLQHFKEAFAEYVEEGGRIGA